MEPTTETLPEQDGLVVYEKKVLAKVNPFRIKLNELKELYKEYPDLSTTKGKDEMRKQIKAFRDLKTETEKARKIDKAYINQFAKSVDGNYGEVYDGAESEQDARDVVFKAKLTEEENAKKEKEEAEKKLFMSRQAELTSLGAIYSDGHFILGTHNIVGTLIGTSPEEVWQNMILKGFKEAAAAIEAERAEEKRLEQERQEKLRQEQEELQRQQEEFNRKQAEFKKQQEEFEAKQREAERLENKRKQEDEQKKRWEEAEKQRELEKDRQDRIRARLDQLDGDLEATPVGWAYNGHIVITDDDLDGFSDGDFNRLRDFHNARVEDNRAEEERIRIAEEERQRIEKEKEALGIYRKKTLDAFGYDHSSYNLPEVSEEDWNELYNEARNAYEAKKHAEWLETERIKAIQEQERERERIADLSEGQRWRLWKDELAKFSADMPQFSSKRYSKMKAIALEKFSEIQLLKAEKISSN